MTLVIKKAFVVSSCGVQKCDVKIIDEKIVSLAESISDENCVTYDATNKYLFPGGIDVHTHFALDVGITVAADDFATGTKAALAGGTTTIIDFVNHIKGKSFGECLTHYKTLSDNQCFCDYAFHLGISDWNDSFAVEMESMVKQGITSFKMYMAYKNILQVSDEQIEKALRKAKELGVLLSFHCEDGDAIDENIKNLLAQGKSEPKYHAVSRDDTVELAAIKRLIAISDRVCYPVYIVHLSSALGYEYAIKKRNEGSQIILETCPQYLLLTDDLYEGTKIDAFAGAKYVISPPLRKQHDCKKLWLGLQENKIGVLATDHCSFNYAGQKTLGKDNFSKIPNGGAGVEHRLQLAYTYGVAQKRLSLEQFVAITAENPAKIFGLFPKKGVIQEGSDADFFIASFDADKKITAKNQFQNLDYTPYEGFDAKLCIESVFLRGVEVFKNNELLSKTPRGQFIKRKKYL
ncbi:MAG: dihydropyrimidinase [Treponemataceae bacterium]